MLTKLDGKLKEMEADDPELAELGRRAEAECEKFHGASCIVCGRHSCVCKKHQDKIRVHNDMLDLKAELPDHDAAQDRR